MENFHSKLLPLPYRICAGLANVGKLYVTLDKDDNQFESSDEESNEYEHVS